MQGIVQAVQTSLGGDYPIEASPEGSTQLAFFDAVDFDPMGGTVDINGLELNYVGVDLDQDLMTLAEPLPVEVTEVDFVATVPATETMEAVVGLADGTVTAEVPHELKPMLEEGERAPEDGEAVLVEEVSVGTFVITSVLGAQAHLDARYVSHADEMLLESKQRLGEVLAENDAAISQAQSDLSEARSRLDDAFSEIDLKPDQAYVDAAKQQAIDAAAVDASTKANAVSSALDAAQTALEAAIASGDSGAIADAEALIAAAKAEAIAAAEADATAKAGEAMAKANAALTAAQSAQATADNAIRTYYAETPPWPNGSSQPEESLGDMWYRDSTGQAYRWNGTEWKVIVDQTIGQALAAAQGAQATADGKITAFYQDSAPLEAEEGDLWFDTNDNSKIYYRRSGQWVVGSNPKALADAAQSAAVAQAKQDAADALTDAKAYTVTQTNGISRSYDSTALPGTTEAPQDSVWYQRDSEGKIVAVFVQKGAGLAADWQARTITSEVIDNLDVGKLTALEGTINGLVAQTFATQLANIIEANIGNLTVTGDTHLEDLVAQTIAGDTAEFMSLTVDQILAGFLQAQWIITESGSIIAGDPAGARVEIRHDGVRVYVVGPNGDPYEAVVMVNGEISFGVIGQDGTRLGGIGADGSVAGTSGSFSKEVSVKGLPVTGQLGGGARFGWLDNLPRGIIAINRREKTLSASTETERRYLYVTATLYPGRLYRVSARVRMQLNAQGALTYLRIRHSQGSGRVPIDAELLGTELGTATSPTTGNRRVSPMLEAFYSVETEQVHSFVSTFVGFYGAAPNAESGYIYVEDVGPLVPDTGGDDGDTADTVLYQSTWRAQASHVWNKNGSRITAKDNKVSTWFWHGSSSDFQSSGWLYDGGVIDATDALEFGKTLPQALTGATVHKAEIYLRNKVWYNDVTLGDLALGSLASSYLPDSKLVDGTLWVDDIAQGEGAWIEVPASWFGGGTNRGITLGDHDGQALNGAGVLEVPTSGEFHGPNDSDPPLLRITYSR